MQQYKKQEQQEEEAEAQVEVGGSYDTDNPLAPTQQNTDYCCSQQVEGTVTKFPEESSPSNHGSSADCGTARPPTPHPQQQTHNPQQQQQQQHYGGSSDDTQNQVSLLEDESNSRERKKAKLMDRPCNGVKCPRCCSDNTKFCYFNNRDEKQPRYYCRKCQRFWTQGGNLRNVPPGSGRRKNKKHKISNEQEGATEGQQGVCVNSSAQSNNVHVKMNMQNNSSTALPQFPHPAVVAPLLFNPLLAAHISAQQMLQLPQLTATAQTNVGLPLSVQASLQSLLTAGNNKSTEELAEGFVPYQQQNLCSNNGSNNSVNKGGNDQSGESNGVFGDVPTAFQILLNAQLQQLQMQQQLMQPQLWMQQQCSKNNAGPPPQNQSLDNVINCNAAMQWQSPFNGLEIAHMQPPMQPLKHQDSAFSGQSVIQQNVISQQQGSKVAQNNHQQCNPQNLQQPLQSFWHPSCSSAKLTW
eukprot:TRINITY_DN13843_c0_g4_i1.p1 TRINITY_DN13843_c0_g4~~TRINITY_DN13843_c0_g4_i1.p1  ORF type:complete len:467 (-),score=52.41 TRINITY_DN13843_c0_g4_i1:224-1624(-)